MVIRQLKEEQFRALHRALIRRARPEPLEASYTVNMTLDGTAYAVKLQPEQNNKVAVLQALRFRAPAAELITRGSLLSLLLEVLIAQEAGA